ncbi:hypothetical protein OROGR_017322 [Orobanche gracilis]
MEGSSFLCSSFVVLRFCYFFFEISNYVDGGTRTHNYLWLGKHLGYRWATSPLDHYCRPLKL